MDIAVIGHGYVGSAFAVRAVAAGHRVYATKRAWNHPAPLSVLPITYQFGDSRPSAMPDSVDALVFCAAAASHSEAAYEACYLAGLSATRRLFKRPPQRVLFTSSTSVYGESAGGWVNEDTTGEPSTFAGRVMLAAEASLRDHPEAVALRLGGIYGPGRDRMLRQLRSGQLALIEGEARYSNRIHRDDAAAILLHLLQIAGPKPVYNGVDCEPAPHNEIVSWLVQKTGGNVAQLPVSSSDDNPLRGNKRVSNARLLGSGYQFIYPTYREGFEKLI